MKRGKMSEEHKFKISQTHKRIGVGKWMKNRVLPKSSREKMSLAKKGKKNHPQTMKTRLEISKKTKGANHYNWRGGITILSKQIRKTFEYRQWRSDVFTRDIFTCQYCLKKGMCLEAHHIKEFSKIIFEYKIKTVEEALLCDELWNINNGLTLCKKCHKKTFLYKLSK